MARTSLPSSIVPFVWNDGSDDFSHVDLTANWDALDAYLTVIDSEKLPLGSITMWWRPSNAITIPTGTVWQPCDGRALTSGDHDFPGGGTITLPDMRNKLPLGAVTPGTVGSPAVAYPGEGTAGTQAAGNNNATYAPGISGVQGANTILTLPSHFHTHSHIHQIGPVTNATLETRDATYGDFISSSAAGSGLNLSKASHAHNLNIFSSNARQPDAANQKVSAGYDHASDSARSQSTTQQVQSGGTATDPTGGSAGGALAVDGRPLSFGVLFIVKVKFG